MAHEAATYAAALAGKTPAETKDEVDAATTAARSSYQSSFEATEEQYQARSDLDGTPVITMIDPDAYEAQEEDETLTLTLTGNDFTGVTSVTLGGVAATEVAVNTDLEIEATFPIPAEAGDLDVIAHKGELHSNAVVLAFTIAA